MLLDSGVRDHERRGDLVDGGRLGEDVAAQCGAAEGDQHVALAAGQFGWSFLQAGHRSPRRCYVGPYQNGRKSSPRGALHAGELRRTVDPRNRPGAHHGNRHRPEAFLPALARGSVRGDAGRVPLAGAVALQHRRRRPRQTRAVPSRDVLGGLAGTRAFAHVRRHAGAHEPNGERAPRPRRWRGRPRSGHVAALAGGGGHVPGDVQAGRHTALALDPLRRRCDRAPAARLLGEGDRHRCGQSRPDRPHPRRPADLEHVLVVEAFGRAVEQASDRFETLDTPADHPAQIYYTSGTTGLAKGIVHAHRYLRNGGYDPQQTVYVLEKYSVRNLFASRPCSGRWPRSETSRTATPPSRSGMPARPVSR